MNYLNNYVPGTDDDEEEDYRFHPRDVVPGDDLLLMPGVRYLVPGVLTEHGLTVAWGPPKDGGKSTFWLRLARRLSQGLPVFGSCPEIRGQIGSLYIATEGQAGLRDRVEALFCVDGPALNFSVITKPLNLLDRRDVNALLFAMGENVDLVVIDTLARLIGASGADENSADMGRLIANLDLIRDRTGAQMVLVHHGAKAGSSGPRGHGSLIGAADTVIEHAKLGDGSRTATVTAARDGAPGQLMRYGLRPIHLPPDAHLPARSAVIAEEMSEPPPVPVAKARRSRSVK